MKRYYFEPKKNETNQIKSFSCVMDEAEQLFAQGYYNESLNLFHEAESMVSNSANDKIHLGHLYTRLGCIYSNSVGGSKNTSLSKDYFSRAMTFNPMLADQGDPVALCDLGYMYSFGCGVAQNKKQAFTYYIRSAEKGYARALFNVAEMYKKGTGVDADLDTAIKYFQLAADKGNMKALSNLGLMYKRGQGRKKDEFMALQYFKKAASQGHKNSLIHVIHTLYTIGRKYETGDETKQNLKSAVHYYFKILKIYSHGRQDIEKLQAEVAINLDNIYKGNGEGGNDEKLEAISYLVDKWPKSYKMVNRDCLVVMCELALYLKKMETHFPTELIPGIMKYIILVWPSCHFY